MKKKGSFLWSVVLILSMAGAALAEGQRVRITLDDGSTVEGALEDYGSRTYRVAVAGGRTESLDEGRVRKVEFMPEGAQAEADDDRTPKVSMQFANADVRIVLDLLGRQCGKYMSIAPDVSGNVSVDVRNVYYESLLGTICKTLDLEYAAGGDGVVTVRRRPAQRGPETGEQFAERLRSERAAAEERVERERGVNVAAFAALDLSRVPGRPWRGIVGGEALGPDFRFRAICDAADAVTRGAAHRFIFQDEEERDDAADIGASDRERNLGMMAFGQLGIVYSAYAPEMGTFTLERGARSHTWAVQEGGPPVIDVLLSAPGDGTGVPVRVACGSKYQGPLTLDRATALRTGLHRYAIPGRTRITSAWVDDPIDCERVRVRLRIPELGADEEIVAAVLSDDAIPAPPRRAGPSRAPTAAEMKKLEGPSAEELKKLMEGASGDARGAVVKSILLRELYTEGEGIVDRMGDALARLQLDVVETLYAALEAHARKMSDADAQFKLPAEDLLSQGREIREKAAKVRARLKGGEKEAK